MNSRWKLRIKKDGAESFLRRKPIKINQEQSDFLRVRLSITRFSTDRGENKRYSHIIWRDIISNLLIVYSRCFIDSFQEKIEYFHVFKLDLK